MNMLGELERYCCYRSDGCCWRGFQDNYFQHIKSCHYRSREQLLKDIEQYQNIIKEFETASQEHNRVVHWYEERILDLEDEVEECQEKINDLETIVASLTTKLKTYDKLHTSVEKGRNDSDYSRLARLKGLSMGKAEEKR